MCSCILSPILTITTEAFFCCFVEWREAKDEGRVRSSCFQALPTHVCSFLREFFKMKTQNCGPCFHLGGFGSFWKPEFHDQSLSLPLRWLGCFPPLWRYSQSTCTSAHHLAWGNKSHRCSLDSEKQNRTLAYRLTLHNEVLLPHLEASAMCLYSMAQSWRNLLTVAPAGTGAALLKSDDFNTCVKIIGALCAES